MEFDRKKTPYYFMLVVIIAIVVTFNVSYFSNHISVNSTKIVNYALDDEDITPVRDSAVAGLFYPANTYQLDRDLDGYLEHVPSSLSNRPKLLIVPHAGYRYSAQVAAYAYKRLQPFKNQIKNVFLLGPSHKISVEGVALPTAKKFHTPLGNVDVNTAIISELLKHKKLFNLSTNAHKKEHSLEVQLPFLQKTLGNFTIIPMLYGEADPVKIANALEPYLMTNSSLLIVSADLSHYLDYDTANIVDKNTAKQINASIDINHHQSCGATAINTAIAVAKKFGLVPHLLNMANSGDTLSNVDKVVGYGSWVYEDSENVPELTGIDLEQQHLQNFARHHYQNLINIAQKSLIMAITKNERYVPERNEQNNILFDKGNSFVTLYKGNELRGCIGSLSAYRGIAEDIAANTYSAAIHDSRFTPIAIDELNDIKFTISLLTNFEPITFTSYDNLLSLIEAGKDGLLIKDGQREGLFLPSVWEKFSSKDEFMNELKIKAGLSPSYWSDTIKVFRFKTVEIKNDNK